RRRGRRCSSPRRAGSAWAPTARRTHAERRDNGLEGGVAAKREHVGAVERGDELRPAAVLHLPREPGAGRERYRVVDVNEIEARAGLGEGRGERQRVLAAGEEGVHGALDQVELGRAQAGRGLGAEEVDLVAALRERVAELGGDDAAAAERGVADQAD